MDLKLCSFNCKGFNISKVKRISELMKSCDTLMLQGTWYLQSIVGKLNKYFVDLNTYEISSVNDNVLLSGRPHRGCSFLYKKSLSSSIEPIEIGCNCICCVKIFTSVVTAYLSNVYMPCDTSNNLFLQQNNEVLSHISTNIHYNYLNHGIVAGDLNTDFTSSDSGNTISLTSFIDNENLYSVLTNFTSCGTVS